MSTILEALLLLVGLGLLCVLVFVGYLLYQNQSNSQNKIDQEELAEVVETLEKMVSETDEFIKNTKNEINEAKEELYKLKEDIIKLKESEKAKDTKKEESQKAQKQSEKAKKEEKKDEQKDADLPEQKITTDKVIMVRNLYNMGLSVADIAKRLELGKGEVELILNLKK
ncbi:MAG: hypothetical protein GX196_08110 [Clostridiaceae bacterium]|nr:hypothetical protein [Clostridiaceae bacterium]